MKTFIFIKIFFSKKGSAILILMKTAYIFHDAFSDAHSDWYGWMKTTLEGFGYVAFVPNFPTPAGQSYESWKLVMKNYLATFDEETIFIGHGSGGLFAMRLLEEATTQIQGLFLVASYGEKIGHAGYDRVNESFLNKPFDWQKIKEHAMIIELFGSEDDPFVPKEFTDHLATSLGIDVQFIQNGGHINKASGFTECVPVAQAIKEAMNSIGKTIETVSSEEIKMGNGSQMPSGITSGVEFGGQTPGTPTVPPQTDQSLQTPEQKPTPKEGIHTMYADMSQLVNSNKGSVASSILGKARHEEAEKQAVSPRNPKNIIYTISALVIFIIAIGLIGYVAQKNAPSPTNPLAPKIQSIIQAEAHQKIDITNQISYTLGQNIRTDLATTPPSGTINDIYYLQGGTRASFQNVLTSLGISTLPVDLQSEFNQPYFMHGVGNIHGSTAHFLVIPVTNYDTTFAGMKSWESTMFRDMGIFMDVPDAFLRATFTQSKFASELITNQNMRVLRYHDTGAINLYEQPAVSTAVTTTPTTPVFVPISYKDYFKKNPSALVATPATATPLVTATAITASAVISTNVTDSSNPYLAITAPYKDNDVMLAYFFLNDHTLVITDNVTIVPELIARYDNSQLYNK